MDVSSTNLTKLRDDESTKAPPKSRKARETLDYNTDIDRWKHRDISTNDRFVQLHLRGFQLTPEQQKIKLHNISIVIYITISDLKHELRKDPT